jgi:hypothetical protein
MRFPVLQDIVITLATVCIIQFLSPSCIAQSFRVPGDTGRRWIDTQLDLKPGTLVQLAAKGKVDVGAGWGSYGPEGSQKFANVPGYPAETTYRYGVVARLTQSRSNPDDDLREQWAYGETHDHCAASGGHLWLTMNDDEPKDNKGEFVVDVSFGPCRAESTNVDELHGGFRVTLNGFTVNRQTNEQGAFDSERRSGTAGTRGRSPDGAGDEVYIRADVFVLAGTTGGGFEIRSHRTISSPVMGDTSGFPTRERAGTANLKGGLRSGDSHPTATPWSREGEPRSDRLPMILWEGELRDSAAGMSVVVIPTIWEWDDVHAGDFGQAWDDRLYAHMLRIFTTYGPRFDARNVGPAFQTFFTDRANDNSWFRDRAMANVPIGRSLSQVIDNETRRVLDAVEYSFNMAELTLTYQSARAAARTNFAGVAGVIPIPYADQWLTGTSPDAGTASYTLYVQIERVN